MSVGCEGGEINYDMTVRTTKVARNLLKVQTLFYGILGILHRLGLPEPIDDAIVKIQRLIASLNMLRMSLIAVQTTAGPLGLVMAGVGVVGAALTAGDLVMEVGS